MQKEKDGGLHSIMQNRRRLLWTIVNADSSTILSRYFLTTPIILGFHEATSSLWNLSEWSLHNHLNGFEAIWRLLKVVHTLTKLRLETKLASIILLFWTLFLLLKIFLRLRDDTLPFKFIFTGYRWSI